MCWTNRCCVFWAANGCSACLLQVKIIFFIKTSSIFFRQKRAQKTIRTCIKRGSTSIWVLLLNNRWHPKTGRLLGKICAFVKVTIMTTCNISLKGISPSCIRQLVPLPVFSIILHLWRWKDLINNLKLKLKLAPQAGGYEICHTHFTSTKLLPGKIDSPFKHKSWFLKKIKIKIFCVYQLSHHGLVR